MFTLLLATLLGCIHRPVVDPATYVTYTPIRPHQGLDVAGGIVFIAFPLPTDPAVYRKAVTSKVDMSRFYLDDCGEYCGVGITLVYDRYVKRAELDAALQFLLRTYANTNVPIYVRRRADNTPRTVHLHAFVGTGQVIPY